MSGFRLSKVRPADGCAVESLRIDKLTGVREGAETRLHCAFRSEIKPEIAPAEPAASPCEPTMGAYR